MQSADVVLSMLAQKSTQNSDFVFDRVYRNLFNPDFFRLAYTTISAQIKAMPPGVDAFPLRNEMVQEIIAQLKHETYHPGSMRLRSVSVHSAVYGPQRSLAQPSQLDSAMLVQEVVHLLLQAIYEPLFKDSSHGYRPGRGCHTALTQIQTTGRGTDWVIEGDINTFFDDISYHKLRTLLSRKICDGRFLNLIDMFQHAEYLQFQASYGLISSLLANIYLHELDQFMERCCVHAAGNVHYTRYATQFIVTIVGGKQYAEQVCAAIKTFLVQELQMVLCQDVLRLTHLADQRVRFLGYEIARRHHERLAYDPQASKAAATHTAYDTRASLQLLVPGDVIQERLKPFIAGGKAIHHSARVNLSLPELLTLYNAEISELYAYYCLATDVHVKIGKFRYYHYYSLVKTVALKEKCSVKQVLRKYGVQVRLKQAAGTHRLFGVTYETSEGTQTVTYFNDSLRKKSILMGEPVAQL
jgi:Retron-type reverse transcriptase